MKKPKLFLILGIGFIILSIIFFYTLKTELIAPNCVTECGKFLKFTDVFKSPLGEACPAVCRLNEEGKNYTLHSPVYYFSFWIGAIFLIMSLITKLVEMVKKENGPNNNLYR